MKQLFSGTIGKVDLDGLIRHTQQLTTSVMAVINRGLSVADNLNAAYVTQLVVSGRPFTVSSPQVQQLVGAFVVSHNSKITGQTQRRVSSKEIEITIEFEGPDADEITVLLLGP